jgi:hypothetical protein
VLVSQLLFFLRISKAGVGRGIRVGNSLFADTPAAHEYLSLEQSLALARFTLHVIDRIVVLYIGIEAENHGRTESLAVFFIASTTSAK